MRHSTVLFTVLVMGISFLSDGLQAEAGTITIFQRESSGRNVLFAGSGGAVNQHDESDSQGALTGAFSFSDSGMVAISPGDPFSRGGANAEGAISLTDNVVQLSPSSVQLTATRTASSIAASTAGTGNGQSTQSQTFRVRFTVGNDPVLFSLTGDFDPGATTGIIGEAGKISLRRPFTTLTPISIATLMTGINETGILMPGNTFEFLVRMNDTTRASAGSPFASDASSLNIVFTLESIPEPTSTMIFLLAAIPVACRRNAGRLRDM